MVGLCALMNELAEAHARACFAALADNEPDWEIRRDAAFAKLFGGAA